MSDTSSTPLRTWMCVVCGFAMVSFFTTANGYAQTTSAPEYRGRVMAVYAALFIGSSPLGAPLLGWAADVLGARASIAIAGVMGLLAACIGGVWLIARKSKQRVLQE